MSERCSGVGLLGAFAVVNALHDIDKVVSMVFCGTRESNEQGEFGGEGRDARSCSMSGVLPCFVWCASLSVK